MIRLLHLSDVHLGGTCDDFGEQADVRRQEILEAFRGLPQVADTERVDAVLIAGDLFDSPTPTDYTLAVVRQTLRRLVDAGRPVFIIPGNHDAITCHPDLFAEQFGGAHIFRGPWFRAPISVETSGGPLHVYGLGYDWARPEPLDTFQRSEAPGAHVVLLHGCMAGMPNWRWYPNALRIPAEWLRRVEADYVALGDSHSFRAPSDVADGNQRACYSGSFAALDLAETGQHGWVLAEVESGAPPRVEHKPSRTRRVFDVGQFDVGGSVDDEALAAAVADKVPEEAIPAVTLTGELSFPLQVERVQERLAKRFGCARVLDTSWYASSSRLDEVAERDTIAGHVVRLGRQRLEHAERHEDDGSPDLAERAMRLALRALRIEG